MTEEQKKTNEANSMSDASNWLTSLPIKKLRYKLNKEQFEDADHFQEFRRDVCGSRFDFAHFASLVQEGRICHNEILGLASIAITEVFPDVR